MSRRKVPPNPIISAEPAVAALWRELLGLRDSLAAEARAWSAVEHPIRQNEQQRVALYGSASRSAETLTESDAVADLRAEDALGRLAELDQWIDSTTRWKADQRGATVAQLEEAINGLRLQDARNRAEVAVAAWLRSREEPDLRHVAALWLWRFEHRSPRGTPTDFLSMERRLVEIELADRESRNRAAGEPSGEAMKRAARILAAAQKSWAQD